MKTGPFVVSLGSEGSRKVAGVRMSAGGRETIDRERSNEKVRTDVDGSDSGVVVTWRRRQLDRF